MADENQHVTEGADIEAAKQARLRRNRIAEGFAFALVQHLDAHNPYNADQELAGMCRLSVRLAYALIAELDK